MMAAQRRRDPSIAAIVQGLGGSVEVMPVPAEIDCSDGFIEAFYARPEAFLDPAVRGSRSTWNFIDAEVTTRFVDRLGRDLHDGTWNRRYGDWRTRPTFDGSLRLIMSRR